VPTFLQQTEFVCYSIGLVESLLAICWQLANILEMSTYQHHSDLDLKSVGSGANSVKSLFINSFSAYVGIVGTFSK
jgi:hypothetical protein